MCQECAMETSPQRSDLHLWSRTLSSTSRENPDIPGHSGQSPDQRLWSLFPLLHKENPT